MKNAGETMTTLTGEELHRIADTDHVQCGDAAAMARELLAYREASKEPVAWKHRLVELSTGKPYDWRVSLNPIQATEGESFRCEAIPLYTAPPPLQAVTVPGGWVKCSERIPEPNAFVQVSNGVWVGIGMYSDAEHLEPDERWQDEHREFIDLLHFPVTHWMPLPAAPEVVQ